MDKGITFFFGFEGDYKKRAQKIKDAGFTSVMTIADPKFDYQSGTIAQQTKTFKNVGLKPTSLHMQYNNKDLPYFFKIGKIGDRLEKTLIKDVKTAHKYGFKCVVVHLKGVVSEVGINRLNNILKVCEKLNVPLAIENIDKNNCFEYVLNNIKSPYIKFCFDVGHFHCFTPNENYLQRFGDKLICVHLHDNMGNADTHTLNRFGNTNWEEIAKQLAKCPTVSLDYELLFKDETDLTMDQALAECVKQANELENLILKYKNKK